MNIPSLGLSMTTKNLSIADLVSSRANTDKTGTSSNRRSKEGVQNISNSGQSQLAIVSEKYSINTMTLNYSNDDGDSVSLSASSVDYQKAILAANDDTSSESWQKIIDEIKDEYIKMKGAIVDKMFGGNEDKTQQVSDPRAFDETKAISGLPDYWNAENTSQRIVDFAVSFAGMFQGGDDKFVTMIKDAIEKGFSQAKDILGKMPDAVGKLTDKTYALVMDKIDKWASDRTSAVETTDNQSAAASV
jgi:hypothetical protein